MRVKVVDASALGTILFGEPLANDVAARLRGFDLVAPTLLGYEIASIYVKKLRMHPELRDKLKEAFALRGMFSITEVDVSHEETVELALRYDLTVYDAAYLWLAGKLGAEVVTLDDELTRALQNRGPSG